MSVFALIAIAAVLFAVNIRTTRQPAKAVTYLGAWFMLFLALAMIIMGVPTIPELIP